MNERERKEKQRQYFEDRVGSFFKLFVSINGYQYNYSGELMEVWEDKILINDIKAGEVPVSMEGLTVMTVSEENLSQKKAGWRGQ